MTCACGLKQADLGLEVFSFSLNRERVRERGNRRRNSRAGVQGRFFPIIFLSVGETKK